MYKYVLTTVIIPVTLLLCVHRFHTAHRHIPARLNHPVNICHPSSINALHTPCIRVLLYSVVHYYLPLLIGASASENYHGELNGSHATHVYIFYELYIEIYIYIIIQYVLDGIQHSIRD